MHTSRGDIKIKFYPYYAPFTVLNFIALAEKGFYNNTTFHRVVPGFVIQGGDPLNSGWGGPEYTIRSEFIPLSFERGALGMASDGKDTEGSQFFIMHSPYYHLDNSYTVFGEVVSGMDIVDKIYLDDYVQSIEIKEN
ncbi:MAG: peptidylprolyl isomerase [Bacteroidetes bacterium]|nr:peptidylprolyl isomerase [Bacteroidota bacterium]